ncbi:MAG: transglycosylase domain-containing protein [Apilactobacillus waqarii]|uniref:transglycosylase domain-containing protein n=1 Tax=Apilactobacillus waqarii TaxID=2851006 RepID=UPI003F40709F
MKNDKKPKSAFKNIWHRYQLTRWIIVMFLLLFFVMSAYCTFVAKTTHVQDLQSSLEQSTVIYDGNNKKAGKIYSQKGTYVGFKDISPNIPNAILSTEDRNFYNEHGFSVKGFGRAILLMIKNKIMRRDYISGGGSTLTQQLVKNAYLTQQQTFSRKLKELFLSIQVENVYSKNQILTMYMNNSYFGNGVYGVEDASRRYFGMNAKDLPVQDAAVIAGMLTNPSAYNPVDHPKLALDRRNVVLQLMADNNKISQSEANKLKKTPIQVKNTYQYKDGYKYPYYFDAVIDEAINKYGLSESDIMNRGYKIYTTLNQDQQNSMQDDFANDSNFPSNASDGTKVQAASIALDPSTGGVTAVVGGRGQHVFRGYNRATQIKRQPGSTIKPLAVYTPALENGYNYNDMLQNKKTSYGSNKYTPENYNNVYTGTVPMYTALAQSMNAPAVWLLHKIGVDKGYESVKSFGLPVQKKDKNLALALGGLSSGVSPQQMAGAYTAFANEGNMTTPHYIRKIVDSSGNVIVNNESVTSKKVMSKDVANKMTSMMLGVFDNGTGASAKPSGYSIAGKTGSTEADNTGDSDATRDKWIIGYTPKVVVATWEGFDNTNAGHHLENLSGTGVGPLFKTELQQILPTTGNNNFSVKDAAYMDSQEKKANSSSDSSFWDSVSDGANQVSKSLGKGWDNLKKNASNWWNDAKKFVGD